MLFLRMMRRLLFAPRFCVWLILLLSSQRLRRGRCDPKAQLLGLFVRRARLLSGARFEVAASRGRYKSLVTLCDHPPKSEVRVEDIEIAGCTPRLWGRLYRPPHPAGDDLSDDLPLVCFVHGGGWVQGDLDAYQGLCTRLVAAGGFVLCSLSYRLAPEHPFPAALDDVYAGACALRAQARSLGTNPDRFALAGDSAGGNLAAASCIRLARAGLAKPRALGLIYPSLDLTPAWDLPLSRSDDAILPQAVLSWYRSCYLPSGVTARDPLVSPLLVPDVSCFPPSVVLHAGCDPLAGDARAFAARLLAAGIEVTEQSYPEQIHAFLVLTKVIAQGLPATDDFARALAARLEV